MTLFEHNTPQTVKMNQLFMAGQATSNDNKVIQGVNCGAARGPAK